ncbi:MAG: GNAT family N-acetyltransferase [Thermoanaerobaculia bacterium]|nr:GNAT family N-acetyltransferase [Thermoanaerobaculia bacterium]
MTHSDRTLRPTFLPDDGWGDRHSGRLVLRDGARLALRTMEAEDLYELERFLGRLNRTEQADVARSLGVEDAASRLAVLLTDSSPPGHAFVACTESAEESSPKGRIWGFAAYRLSQPREAAVTLAVAPERRRRGLAGLLLERLMVLAAQHGVDRMVGTAHEDNIPLVELFQRDGFDVEEERDGPVLHLTFSTRAMPQPSGRTDFDDLSTRVYAAASLHSLFYPRSVAVMGASRKRSSVGYRILDALVKSEFQGPVFPVNPKADHVGSIRAYPTIAAIGASVDLAVIAVPARLVQRVVDECAAAGVHGLVVITAGFAEVGQQGREAQDRLLETVRRNGLRMVGPNCLGLLHTDPNVQLNASFAPLMPPPGTVALGSQSGALGIAIIALARRLGLGLSSFVSVGNKADVSGNDLLEYWEEDPRTQVVLFYLESFGNPRRFARIARRVGRSKPIVVVKAGRSRAGQRAASSHTAALTAADTAVDALFQQTGILRAETLEEMFSIARALVDQPLPGGRRVAVVTNAGGPGILCADAMEASGLEVAPLTDATQAKLREFLPAEASAGNPVDMIASADPEQYRKAVKILLADDQIDAVAVIYTPAGLWSTTEIGLAVSEGMAATRENGAPRKPVLASIVGDEAVTYRLEAPQDEAIPVFAFPEEMGRALGKIARYAEWRRDDPGVFPEPANQDLTRAREICRRALDDHGDGWLAIDQALAVFEAAGLDLAPGGLADSPDEAARLADEIGYPVAIKLASRKLVHKTEYGGVALDLEDTDGVRRAYERMTASLDAAGLRDAMDGVLVQPMVTGSAEVMIGVDQDPVFGPLVAFGLGGIHVEILRDVQFRVAPLSDRDAHEMVRGVKGYRLLQGYRGHPAADVEALKDALLRISRLAEAVPEIASLDLNPLFAREPGGGYLVVDARIRVSAV